jgi:hypothetical protein
MATSTFNMIVGRNGRTLSDEVAVRRYQDVPWPRRGFPNLFIVTGPQGGGGSFNFTDAIDTHSDYIVWMLDMMREQGIDVVDVKSEPEQAYVEHCRVADMSTAPLRDCLSYYNGHGEAAPGSLAYYGGGNWHKYRVAAQETLDPYDFGRVPS